MANVLQNKSSQVIVYHAKSEPETIQLLTSEYSDQISEFIVAHILERYELVTEPPEEPTDTQNREASPSKKAADADRQEVESEGKYELHVSNISLKATESDLRKLFEGYGDIYRVKLLRRGTMQKAFVDMENERVAQKCIDALDGYDLHQ